MKTNILYVDDEAEWRRMVGMFFKLAGFGVLTAKDASEAMHQAETGRPKVIILDVNLAGEDGAELIGYLKGIDPDVPVILYTGLDHGAEAIQRLLERGAVQYLRKGNLRDLVKYVEDLLLKRDPASSPCRPPVLNATGWQMV